MLVVVIILAGGWAAVQQAASRYYTFAPGTAPRLTASSACRPRGSGGSLALPDGTPCARLVVPSSRAHRIDGEILMVDVLVGPASAGEYLESKLGFLHTFHDGMRLLPRSEVLGQTPPSQFNCQGSEEMAQATADASVAALRTLGYAVTLAHLGAKLALVGPGTPAASAGLRCGDVVQAVGGTPVRTAEDLVRAIQAAHPGDKVAITVERAAGGKHETLHLDARLSGAPAEQDQPADPSRAFLGVSAYDDVRFNLPFHVGVQVGDIGGPSAGLAMTLGLLDALSGGRLTGGHRVAATGVISPDGSIGPVGGVAQKAVAVREAGAQYFLVPKQEYAKALSEARSMKVLPVTSLSQALEDLRALGGSLPSGAGSRS